MNWNEVPSLAALRAFDALARNKTMTVAAASLNVTHAAITQHVRALEDHLNTRLIERDGRNVKLTPQGRDLADALAEGFGAIHAGIRSIVDGQQDSPLAISTTPSFAENWLLPRLGAFWSAYPDIMLSISPSTSVVDLRRDQFDLAVRYGKGNWPNIDATFLIAADYVVAAAPALIKDRKVQDISDLALDQWLFDEIHHEPRRWAAEGGLDFDCCQVKTFETGTMSLSALRAGVGVSVVSRPLIEKDLKDGTLQQLIEMPNSGMAYYIVHDKRGLSDKAKVLKKWMLNAV